MILSIDVLSIARVFLSPSGRAVDRSIVHLSLVVVMAVIHRGKNEFGEVCHFKSSKDMVRYIRSKLQCCTSIGLPLLMGLYIIFQYVSALSLFHSQ